MMTRGKVAAVFRTVVWSVGVSAALGLLASAETAGLGGTELPEDFFGKSESMEAPVGHNPEPGFPIFPRVGNLQAPVSIEYFYSSDCESCADASRALFTLLSQGEDVNVTFHGVGTSEEAYVDAIGEVVLFSIEPKLFELFHFGSMMAFDQGKTLNSVTFMGEIAAQAGQGDVLRARMEHYEEWTASLTLNSEILSALEAENLPVFVINDVKYEGFASLEDLVGAIRIATGEELMQQGVVPGAGQGR